MDSLDKVKLDHDLRGEQNTWDSEDAEANKTARQMAFSTRDEMILWTK